MGKVDDFLIVKRGLFWRPNAQGYTGIRDEAGRYSEEAARFHAEHGECTIIHEDDAPEFMAAAFSDLVIKHLTKQRDDLCAELDDDQIMTILHKVCGQELFGMLTFKRWKNGIDIDHPTFAAQRLAAELRTAKVSPHGQ